jgi:hypothetical protein
MPRAKLSPTELKSLKGLESVDWAGCDNAPPPRETKPPGWLTRAEISKIMGATRTKTYGILNDMMREGRCEMRKFYVVGPCVVSHVPCYRLTKSFSKQSLTTRRSVVG